METNGLLALGLGLAAIGSGLGLGKAVPLGSIGVLPPTALVDRTSQNIELIPRNEAKVCDFLYAITQPIGRQGFAPRCKAQVIERFDLPTVLRLF